MHCLCFFVLCVQPFKEKATVRQDSKRMPPARCAQLMSIAIANRMNEVWISPNPVLLFVYVSQYCPVLYDWWVICFPLEHLTMRRKHNIAVQVNIPFWDFYTCVRKCRCPAKSRHKLPFLTLGSVFLLLSSFRLSLGILFLPFRGTEWWAHLPYLPVYFSRPFRT